MKTCVLGQGLPRIDAVPKVDRRGASTPSTSRCRGCSSARSCAARTRTPCIKSIDTSAARQVKGVRAVITAEDVPDTLFSFYKWLADKTHPLRRQGPLRRRRGRGGGRRRRGHGRGGARADQGRVRAAAGRLRHRRGPAAGRAAGARRQREQHDLVGGPPLRRPRQGAGRVRLRGRGHLRHPPGGAHLLRGLQLHRQVGQEGPSHHLDQHPGPAHAAPGGGPHPRHPAAQRARHQLVHGRRLRLQAGHGHEAAHRRRALQDDRTAGAHRQHAQRGVHHRQDALSRTRCTSRPAPTRTARSSSATSSSSATPAPTTTRARPRSTSPA